MGKYPVTAADKGYFGGMIREPGDKFSIDKVEELGSWMIPNGWTPPKKGKEPVLSKDAKAALAAQEAEETVEDDEPQLFAGVEESYGTDTVRVTKQEAVDRAMDTLDTDTDTWNKMTVKDRKSAFMAAVKELVNEGIAREAAEGEEAEG